jgi:hypothetical protein
MMCSLQVYGFEGRSEPPAANRQRTIAVASLGRAGRLGRIHGRDDVQNSIDDIYLSLDHGDPESARVFDGGHMGEGPTLPTIGAWLEQLLQPHATT